MFLPQCADWLFLCFLCAFSVLSLCLLCAFSVLAVLAVLQIDIEAEHTEDWWTGSANGQRGLLPSNHVELITSQGTVAV